MKIITIDCDDIIGLVSHSGQFISINAQAIGSIIVNGRLVEVNATPWSFKFEFDTFAQSKNFHDWLISEMKS